MLSTNTPTSKAGGLLLAAFRAGTTEPINWVDITVGDLVVTVASDAMKATVGGRAGVRLPVSYRETIEICRELDCVAPTQSICDAIFSQARSPLNFVPLVRTAADTAKMTSVEFALRFNDGIEKQLGAQQSAPGLIGGAWKYWLLHPRLAERGAVNYGFWDKSHKPAKPIQSVGGQHDALHYDYSQILQPVRRIARHVATGAEVDLLDYIASHDHVPARFLDVYRPGPIQSFEEELEGESDLLTLLQSTGVEVEPADGWKDRGRKGFSPAGILVHHTAGAKSGDAPSLALCIQGRPDLSGPLCHILLSRSGKAHLIAANIANHAGKGAQQVLDMVRKDEVISGSATSNRWADAAFGNQFFYGIEVENSGQSGDPYPPEQIEALARICAALCHAHRWSANRVVHHRQWTSRKIDMSWRGDLNGMVAQYMDAGFASFELSEDPTEPIWEPPHDGASMHCCEAEDET